MKKILIVATFIVIFIFMPNLKVQAHPAYLTIEYDICEPSRYKNPNDIGDGYNERWYYIDKTYFSKHISHTTDGVTTIKYYFNPTAKEKTNIKWATGLTEAEAEKIKKGYKESMEKWNNVYFYIRNANGMIIKKQLVNVVEGTENDYNLIIYPYSENEEEIASTEFTDDGTLIDKMEYEDMDKHDIFHYHYSKAEMEFNIYNYKNANEYCRELLLKRTGAHELGHVLGLKDLDGIECYNEPAKFHHQEVLMGYQSAALSSAQSEITYKDLVGVAITRGYHTDDDHKWLYDSESSTTGHYKLICTICNGVKYVSDLTQYLYSTYRHCGDNHNLDSGNMMAVASYGTKDYYKCKYCRYVAPFTSIVAQDYQYEDSPRNNMHMLKNMVKGLEYYLPLEEGIYGYHTYVNNVCILCGHIAHTHDYGAPYVWKDNRQHSATCACGQIGLQPHIISNSLLAVGKTARCLLCGGITDMGFIQFSLNNEIEYITENGSYVLPNGVIVLVDADMEAFYKGTLYFQ